MGIGDAVLLEKRKESKLSASYESDPYIATCRQGDQVVMPSPQGVQGKRNLQRVEPLAIPDTDYSTGDNPDRPDQPSSPDHVDPNPQQSEPTGSVYTASPRRSGRVSRPPRALEIQISDFIINNH